MPISRFFAPHFVTVSSSCFLAVDRVQPVLVAASEYGTVVDVASWGDRVPVPAESPWPNRRIAIDGDRLLVQDLPTEPVIAAAVRPNGTIALSVEPAETFPESGAYHRRMWTAAPVRDGEPDTRWQFRSHLDRIFWSAEAAFDGDTTLHFACPASIVSRCTHGTTAAVCVQGENKRPFPLHPSSQLHILSADGATLVDHPVDEVDITDRCWQPHSDLADERRELCEYMSFPLGELHAADHLGLREAHLMVHGVGQDTVLETRFRLDEYPDTVFCRQDRPYDELGHLCGLSKMNVLLDEDISGGSLPHMLASEAPITYL